MIFFFFKCILFNVLSYSRNQRNCRVASHKLCFGCGKFFLNSSSVIGKQFNVYSSCCNHGLAWSLYLVKHETKLEKVPRYATRLVPERKGMSYEEGLHEMHVMTLEDIRVRGHDHYL